MDVTVREGRSGLRDLSPEWTALAADDPAATVFHLPEFALVWADAFADDRSIRTIELRRGSALAGVVAMRLDDGGLRFLADPGLADYLGPVSRWEDRDLVAAAIIEAAVGLAGWDSFELGGLAADSGWAEALARAGKAAGMQVEERQLDACPRVHLGGPYAHYLESIPGKLRHEIRRKARRLEREVGGFSVRVAGGTALEDDLERFYSMHRSSDGPKGKFLHEGMASFFTGLARSFRERGWLRLAFLEAEGRPLAGLFGFVHGGTWSVYNSAFDHAFRAVSPGMVLVAEAIHLAAEEGCDTFDFLRGTEEYKYRFGAADLPLLELTLRRP